MSKCRSCPAYVQFALQRHNPNAKPNPLDVEPSEKGNLLLDTETMTYEILSGEELERARAMPHIKLYTSHFATCERPHQHRRK